MMSENKKHVVLSAAIASAICFSVSSVYAKDTIAAEPESKVTEDVLQVVEQAEEAESILPTSPESTMSLSFDSQETPDMEAQVVDKEKDMKMTPEVSAGVVVPDVPVDPVLSEENVSVDSVVSEESVPVDKVEEIIIDSQTSSETTGAVVVDEQDESEQESEPFSDSYIKKHVRLGTRTVLRKLTDGDSGHKGGWYRSGTFLGTIYGLEEVQYPAPVYLYVQYLFNKYFGVELGYDRIEAETRAMGVYPGQPFWDLKNGYEKTDGNVILSGPVVSLLGFFPNKSAFTPYVRFGLGFMAAEFDRVADWRYASNGGERVMNVDDQVALQLGGGVEWKFYKQWSVNASILYTKVTVDTSFDFYNSARVKIQPTQFGEYPMDNVALLLGIAYSF